MDRSDSNGCGSDDGSSSSAEELLLDDEGRVPFAGTLDYAFRSYTGALKLSGGGGAERDLQRARRDARSVFRVKEAGSEYGLSAGETYWMAADAEPRCALEALAQAIFKHHTRAARFDRAISGAEWWVQVIGGDDDIGWHWDKDYATEASGFNVHPHLATVTYLSDVGGPTVVLNKRDPVTCGDSLEGTITRCCLSRPAVGKHMCFDGRYLHGAPAALADIWPSKPGQKRPRSDDGDSRGGGGSAQADDDSAPGPDMRVTFLVNVWLNRHPESADPLDDSTVKTLCQDPFPIDLSEATLRAPTVLNVNSSSSARTREFRWEFGEVGGKDDSDDGNESDGEDAHAAAKRDDASDSSDSDGDAKLERHAIVLKLPVLALQEIGEGAVGGGSFEVHLKEGSFETRALAAGDGMVLGIHGA
ncbi:hypothetical protein JKP88DRAFT_299890 [Tribonema minus]|uniref:Uncharacterized protein n=1 Tax=Tribonema minus TaxID=303371 RepID=A0A835ZJA8_9STRA|nr:hypothetical protein JKP88DRAFT_299890 [Tribonema minus]